jgi:hypothetical protein
VGFLVGLGLVQRDHLRFREDLNRAGFPGGSDP